MKKTIVTLLTVLIVCGCQQLSQDQKTQKQKESFEPKLSDTTIKQITKLYKTIEDIQNEYHNIFNTASYQDEKEKNIAKEWIKKKELSFELIKIDYQYILLRKSPGQANYTIGRMSDFVEVPTYTFARWSSTKYIPFVRLSRIETLQEDFLVQAISVVKDINSELEQSIKKQETLADSLKNQ